MTTNLTILPIVIPMVTGVLALLAAARPRARRAIGVAGTSINLFAAVAILALTLSGGGQFLVLQGGDWPAPFGITVVIDPFAAIMLAAAALVLFSTFVYCAAEHDDAAGGLFHPLVHLLAMGVQWSLLAGDLFNLFVAFEIMLMASYALLILGTTGPQMRQAYKYVLINLLGSSVFVACCGLIYGHVGTLNLADLARMSHGGSLPRGASAAICALLLVFGMKTAVFPLWFWLPDTYPTLPAGLGGLFAGLLTKVGAYVLFRMFVMVFGPADGAVAQTLRPILFAVAGVTMLLGVLGAASASSVRRILSIHVTSQVGYMVLAVGLALAAGVTTEHRELAVAGGIFFIAHNMVVKGGLFLCAGLMSRYSGTDDLDHMGGLARRAPWLATLFLLAALSLAGLPPLSGFFAKYVLIREAFRANLPTLAAVALATSVLTLLSMVKIWCYAFWSRAPIVTPAAAAKPTAAPASRPPSPVAPQMAGAGALVLAALAMGFGAEYVFRACRIAARPVVEPSTYIHAVLGPDQVRPIRPAQAGERGARP
jgi:multicomponent Na+:H+ antiporter subunit D